ncbi:MAG: peptidoglycan-associated lipoprotein Pal [Nitrospiraceae bacterium]|nr:peptidoglycan-associated lipoprotein Pal [Nitrospiraceae bacterium]
MDKNTGLKTLSILTLVAVLACTGGCKSKKQTPIDTSLDSGQSTTSLQEDDTALDGLPDIDQERLLWSPATGLQTVYFDFDSFALRSDAIRTLNENAEKIRQVPNVIIQIEGHCDERGTQEYNLALGEKRALAVRDYLMKLGISGGRLVTISYGEESPVAMGRDESAWKQNRRSQFNKATR